MRSIQKIYDNDGNLVRVEIVPDVPRPTKNIHIVDMDTFVREVGISAADGKNNNKGQSAAELL